MRPTPDTGRVENKLSVYEYNSDRWHLPIEKPVDGILSGTSVSHTAVMIEFSSDTVKKDPELQKLVAELKDLSANDKIYFREITNSQHEVIGYKMYFSFWPETAWDPMSSGSRLETPQHDALVSGRSASVDPRDPKYANITLDTQKVNTSLPILKYFIPPHTIHIPPAITMHMDSLKQAYPYPGVEDAAKNYAAAFSAWANASLKSDTRQIATTKQELDVSEQQLKVAMRLDPKLDHKDFIDKIDPFVVFGNPPKDIATLPITNDSRNTNALALKPMLQYAIKVAKNPKEYPYNLAFLNCSKEGLALIQAGAKHAALVLKMALGIAPVLDWGLRAPVVLPGDTTDMVVLANMGLQMNQAMMAMVRGLETAFTGVGRGHGQHHHFERSKGGSHHLSQHVKSDDYASYAHEQHSNLGKRTLPRLEPPTKGTSRGS